MTEAAPPVPPAPPAPPADFVAEASTATVPRRRLTESDAWPERALSWVFVGFAAVALFTVEVPIDATLYGVPVAAAFGIALLTAGSLPLAMRWPWVAVAAFLAGQSLFLWLARPVDGAPWPVPVTQMIVLGLLGVLLAWHGRDRQAVVLWLGAALLPLGAAFLPDRGATPEGVVASLVTSAAVSAVLIGLGHAAAVTRRRFSQALGDERAMSEAEHERRIIAEERTRIARELHDVVAHRMSIIQVQATSAPYRLTGLDDETSAEFGEIAAAARAAIAEMRELLQVLREPGSEAEMAPQPGFTEIGALVATVRHAGLTVDAQLVTTQPVSTAVGQSAYRIVQEALSNVLRHAPGQRTSVLAQGDDARLVVEVVNTPVNAPVTASAARPSDDRAAGAGHGLIGMRERARLVGGTIEVGPTADGGFRVHAVLPVAARE